MNNVSMVVGLVVVAMVIGRQLRTRPVREDTPMYLIGGLALVGLATFAQGIVHASQSHPNVALASVLLAFTFAVSAGGGALRGHSVHVWRDTAGQAWRRGTALTVALWLASIAMHYELDGWLTSRAHAAALGPATLALSLAITLGAQSLTVRRRATNLSAIPAPRTDDRQMFDGRFDRQIAR